MEKNLKTLQHKHATIAYEDFGDGSPLVFVHCSSASRRQWLAAASKLAARHRCLVPDLMGYGKTSSQFDADGKIVDCSDVDVIDAIVDVAGEPVDIIAHSYGAATTIEFVKYRPDAVRSLLLIEPVSFQVLNNDSTASEWRTVSQLANSIIGAAEAGRPRLAAWHYMSYWIGRLRWLLAPRKFRESVIRTIDKVAYEFSLIYNLSAETEALRRLDIPVTFVSGSRTRSAALAVTKVLAGAFPRATSETIHGAGHMSPFTHPEQVFELIDAHLSAVPAMISSAN